MSNALSDGQQNKALWEDPESTVLGFFCQGRRSTMPRTTKEVLRPTERAAKINIQRALPALDA